jgi:hypothetical protein
MHGFQKKMAIEQPNHGCPNEMGSFDAKHSPPQTRLRSTQSKSDPSGSTYIGKMPHLQLPCQLTQLVPGRRKKSTQQPASCKLRHPNSPGLGRATKPCKYIRNLSRNRRFAITQHPTRILHQHQVLAQRKTTPHPFSHRTKTTTILNRHQPKRIFKPATNPNRRHTA